MSNWRPWLTVLAAPMLMVGCATVGPDYTPPQTVLPDQFINAPEEGLSQAALSTSWWQGFNDPILTELIEQALAANHDIRIAEARLNEARALHREAVANRLPTVVPYASYTNRRNSAQTGQNNQPRDMEYFTAGFDASWELDFFGLIRRSVEARVAAEQATGAQLQATQVSVSAEVARNYFEYRSLQTRVEVAQHNVETQKRTLGLTQDLLNGGRGNALDVARAQAQYSSTVAELPALESAARQTLHRLAVLTGQIPTALNDKLSASATSYALPVLGNIGSPTDLLRRRPDIHAAERELASATASIGVATANLYPRVIIGAGLGTEASHSSDLGDSGTGFWSFVPRINWTFLDSGRLRSRIRQADARAEQALARFEQTVLVALEETENALTRYGRERARQTSLETAAAANVRAAELAHQRLRAGVASFLDVLQAEASLNASEDRLAESRARSAVALVAIYKALGGGWETIEQ